MNRFHALRGRLRSYLSPNGRSPRQDETVLFTSTVTLVSFMLMRQIPSMVDSPGLVWFLVAIALFVLAGLVGIAVGVGALAAYRGARRVIGRRR